jgi:deoxyribonuclease-2
VLWNDELPAAFSGANASDEQLMQMLKGGSGTSGHTKGVLAADAGGGFLLSHTLPKFPDLTGSSPFPLPSTTYGQNFLCLSLDAEGIEAASAGLQHDDPYIYDSAIPEGLPSVLPVTTALVAGSRASGTFQGTLTTRLAPQQDFQQFAKSGSTGLDLYEDVVQPALGLDMWVETWRRSPAMDTYCRDQGFAYDSINVNFLTMEDVSGNAAPFK